MARSHASTSCLCIRCDGFGRAALLLVVPSEHLRFAYSDARYRTRASVTRLARTQRSMPADELNDLIQSLR